MIKPDAYTSIGKIVDAIAQTGFLINKLQMVRFSQADAEEFYGEHIVRRSTNLRASPSSQASSNSSPPMWWWAWS